MIKVSRRGGFSDRQGIKSENTEIQLKDLDTRTRTQIYNLLSEQYKFIYQNIEPTIKANMIIRINTIIVIIYFFILY